MPTASSRHFPFGSLPTLCANAEDVRRQSTYKTTRLSYSRKPRRHISLGTDTLRAIFTKKKERDSVIGFFVFNGVSISLQVLISCSGSGHLLPHSGSPLRNSEEHLRVRGTATNHGGGCRTPIGNPRVFALVHPRQDVAHTHVLK